MNLEDLYLSHNGIEKIENLDYNVRCLMECVAELSLYDFMMEDFQRQSSGIVL